MYNSRPFEELFLYASNFGISRFQMILRIYNALVDLGSASNIKSILNDFLDETRGELWESREALVAHFSQDKNYARLLNGEVGGNLIYKYKAISLAFYAQEWIECLRQQCWQLVEETTKDAYALEKSKSELNLLVQFVHNKLCGLLDVDGDLSPRMMESSIDILEWRNMPPRTPLSGSSLATPIIYDFIYTDAQLRARSDQFKRYGTNPNGLSKIVTRVSNVESLFRKISVRGEKKDSSKRIMDTFTRYQLSN
jgi:hypothetical protein